MKNGQCQQIYDEYTAEIFMFSIMAFAYFLILVYIFLSFFKSCLWALVVLIFENIQILALLTITDSLNYDIYYYYSVLIGFSPGFINFIQNVNLFDKNSYDPYCIESYLSLFYYHYEDYFDTYDIF